MEANDERQPIAIVGMACHFPEAETLDAFWTQLREGRETLTTFTDEELEATGIPPAFYNHPGYVRRRGIIRNYEEFDPAFFDYTDEEAAFFDPQQRALMLCAYRAMEDAGQSMDSAADITTGVFTSMRTSTYSSMVLGPVLAPHGTLRSLQAILGCAPDQSGMRIAYPLNLRGPCIAMQTACSSSLVTIHMACESLQSGECDMAVVGASAFFVPQNHGYMPEEGALLSKDGHCHAFDVAGTGAVPGSGTGVVILKRLADVDRNRERVYARILGTAVNNSGAARLDYRSPSSEGQAAVIAEAIAMAGVRPESISYVETNGTGTFIGDSIEVDSLTRAFAAHGCAEKRPFCGIGSVKTNIGHLTQAAGIAGLIKTVLALRHGELPPSLFYETPNPQLKDTPFYVVDSLRPWPERAGQPRRAGVSAFAIGGTNAHAVLESAPEAEQTEAAPGPHILALSAKTPEALERLVALYRDFLREHPEIRLADISWTSTVGRQHYAHRLAVVGETHETMAAALEQALSAWRAGVAPVAPAGGEADENRLRELARDYMSGGHPDWRAFFEGRPGRCVTLPHYPFERKKIWFGPWHSAHPANAANAAKAANPPGSGSAPDRA